MNSVEELIKLHEGRRLMPYVDSVGKITVGYGRNLTDRGISDSEAEILFQHDLDMTKLYCQSYPWFGSLNDVRQGVILDMVFNMGPNRFREFVQMIAALERSDYEDAARQMGNSLWAREVGNRSIIDAGLLKSGIWI